MSGRPSAYTKEIAETICTRLAGGESLRSICRDPLLPVLSTVLLWAVNDREGFSEQYREARIAQGHSDCDQMRDVALQMLEGEYEPAVAKVFIDTMKWTAERNAPKVYGPKASVDLSSSDGSMTPKSMSDFYADDK